MQALSAVLHLNVKVAYLDGRGAGDEVDFVDFENGAGKDVNGIRDLVLLYRSVNDWQSSVAGKLIFAGSFFQSWPLRYSRTSRIGA